MGVATDRPPADDTVCDFLSCVPGHPDPDQVLPLRVHQGSGELAVEVSHASTATPTPSIANLHVC